MRIGVLADTHDKLDRTREAVQLLLDAGAEAIVHCGDLASPPVVAGCAVRPFWFALGNHDADAVPALERAAADAGAVCLGWGGVVELGGRRVGVTHGHLTADVRRVLADRPDYLLCGHSHLAGERAVGGVRRINPGALHRAAEYTVAVLDTATGDVRWVRVG
jgi:putative phosphoesterase